MKTALYIKVEAGQIIKGDIEKIYLVCYPIFEEKETSCKEIAWGHATQIHPDRRFLMNQEDRSRLEDFRQLRREVRGSREYLLVGIDIAKDKHHAFFGTATGKTLFRRLVFENNLEGFRAYSADSGHSFRSKADTCSGGFRPSIPGDPGHPLGGWATLAMLGFSHRSHSKSSRGFFLMVAPFRLSRWAL